MSLLDARDLAPSWLRQVGRASLALGLGIAVGLSSGNPGLVLGIAAVIATALVVASLRRPDPMVFLAFMVLALPRVAIPGSPLPAGEVLMLIAVTSAWLTRRQEHLRIPRWFLVSSIGLLGIYVFASLINGLVDFATMKRLIHMSVFVLSTLCIGRELLPTRAAASGLFWGLVAAVSTGIILLPHSAYVGRLTGLFGDPNVAGFLLVVLGAVAISRLEHRWIRIGFGLLLLVALIMTFSRTSLLAVLVCVVWFFIGKRLKRGPALLLIGLLVLVVGVLPTSVQSIGPFHNRSGSDELRTRVASQELQSIGSSPIWGHGAGTATVLVNPDKEKFYFHNSYFAMVNEGGILALITYIPMLFGVFLALMGLDRDDRDFWLECALIGVAILGINLGEVLVELASAVAIGFALNHLLVVRHRRGVDDRVQVRV